MKISSLIRTRTNASGILFRTYAVVGSDLWSSCPCVRVIKGRTCGSDFFAIAIQAVATRVNRTRVNRDVTNQILRPINDDAGSCGQMDAVRTARKLHDSYIGKRIVVAGTADLDLLSTMDFGGADIKHRTIFAGLPIACTTTEGGRAFIDEFCDGKVAHIKPLCIPLRSLDRWQGVGRLKHIFAFNFTQARPPPSCLAGVRTRRRRNPMV